MDNGVKKTKQVLLIEDRRRVELNDVEAILSFEDDYITLMTSSGKLVIEGNDMKIVDLSKDTGRVSITGMVISVLYAEEGKRKKNGIFK